MAHSNAVQDVDWLEFARRCAAAGQAVLDRHPARADRGATVGRGEGGDQTLAIDRAVEDGVFVELERLDSPLRAVSEERGEIEIAGGGATVVVIDPIDGSRNAKRLLPAYSLSIAVASGPAIADVEFGFVYDFGLGEEWSAARGEGARLDGEPLTALDAHAELDMLALESTHPYHLARVAEPLCATSVSRVRALGSIALALCWTAAGRVDAMASLAHCRSVDAAAAQLVVREAGGVVCFPDAGDGALGASLALDMRSRVLAACGQRALDQLRTLPPPG